MYVYILLALALFSGLIYLYTRKPAVSPAPKVEQVTEEITAVSTPAPEPVLANPQIPEYTPSPATNPSSSYTLEQVPVIAPRKPIVDAGYPDNFDFFGINRGWYDIVGQGAKNDYCRFVGNYSKDNLACILSKDNENSTSKFGDINIYSTTYNGVNVLDIAKSQTPESP